MVFDPVKVKYEGLVCTDCLDVFDAVSTTGPVQFCQPCTDARVKAIFTDTVLPEHLFPVPGDELSCGLRDEPTLHHWVSLGVDVRHFDDGMLTEARVFACINCGRDRMKSLTPKPKKEIPPPLDPEVKRQRDALRRALFDQGVTGEDRIKALAEFDQNIVKG